MKKTKIRLLLFVGALVVGLDVFIAIWPGRLLLFIINARAGCFPWSPREVEYHDGMTICPGQSARMTIIIAIPKKEDTGI